jgi:hypothetical protein
MVALAPFHTLIEGHVMAAKRLHADDTIVALLARGGTKTARLWTCVRDDRPLQRWRTTCSFVLLFVRSQNGTLK